MDKWLENPTVVKIIALVLGLLLWAVVHWDVQDSPGTVASLMRTEDINNVKITAVGFNDKQFVLRSVNPQVVRVKVKGRDTVLNRFNPEDYQIQLDLSQAQSGTYTLPLRADFPSGVDVLEIYPSQVTVHIEALQKKEIDVTIKTKGTPEKGYKAGTPIVTPTRVHVTLPESELKRVDSVGAEMNIDGLSKTVKDKVKLVAYDRSGNEIAGVQINPAVVEAEVPITRPFKTVPLQVKWIGQPPKGYAISSLTQSVEQVTVYGPQQVLDKLQFYDGLQVDLSNITSNTTFSMDLNAVGKIEMVEPAKVDFDITVVASTVKPMEKVPILISGQNDGFVTKISEPAGGLIDVPLEGAPELMSKLTKEDVQAIVSVADLPPGTHKLPVTVNLPMLIKKGYEGTLYVTVEISPKQSTPTTTNPAEPGDSGTGAGGEPPSGGSEPGSGENTGTGADKPETDPPPADNPE